MKAYWSQARAEVRLTLTQGESLLVTLGIPVLLLVGFDIIKVLPTGSKTLQFLVPGMMALAIMATGMVSLSIATGFERSYGVLKRLSATPLGKRSLMMAKITSIIVVEILQGIVLAVVGLALGWHPGLGILQALLAALLGTVAFSGLGLLLAGALKPEMVLGVANGLYLVLLLTGGMLFPLSHLPGVLATLAGYLPAAALSQALLHSIGTGGAVPAGAWAVLAGWAVAMPLAAAAVFRWD